MPRPSSSPRPGACPGYAEAVEGGDRIDWVLTTEDITTHQAAINDYRDPSGAFASDHLPMQALLSLP